jgi:hypothetical protein
MVCCGKCQDLPGLGNPANIAADCGGWPDKRVTAGRHDVIAQNAMMQMACSAFRILGAAGAGADDTTSTLSGD